VSFRAPPRLAIHPPVASTRHGSPSPRRERGPGGEDPARARHRSTIVPGSPPAERWRWRGIYQASGSGEGRAGWAGLGPRSAPRRGEGRRATGETPPRMVALRLADA
jgi:hypothetical protein